MKSGEGKESETERQSSQVWITPQTAGSHGSTWPWMKPGDRNSTQASHMDGRGSHHQLCLQEH